MVSVVIAPRIVPPLGSMKARQPADERPESLVNRALRQPNPCPSFTATGETSDCSRSFQLMVPASLLRLPWLVGCLLTMTSFTSHDSTQDKTIGPWMNPIVRACHVHDASSTPEQVVFHHPDPPADQIIPPKLRHAGEPSNLILF